MEIILKELIHGGGSRKLKHIATADLFARPNATDLVRYGTQTYVVANILISEKDITAIVQPYHFDLSEIPES